MTNDSNERKIERLRSLKEEYKVKIEDLWKESKGIDIFYGSHNSTRYKVDKEGVTTALEVYLKVVKDLEEL